MAADMNLAITICLDAGHAERAVALAALADRFLAGVREA